MKTGSHSTQRGRIRVLRYIAESFLDSLRPLLVGFPPDQLFGLEAICSLYEGPIRGGLGQCPAQSRMADLSLRLHDWTSSCPNGTSRILTAGEGCLSESAWGYCYFLVSASVVKSFRNSFVHFFVTQFSIGDIQWFRDTRNFPNIFIHLKFMKREHSASFCANSGREDDSWKSILTKN